MKIYNYNQWFIYLSTKAARKLYIIIVALVDKYSDKMYLYFVYGTYYLT